MANDMMIAALQKQRMGKMDLPSPQSPSGQDKSGGDIEARLSALEQQYQELCDYVGMPKKGEETEKPAVKIQIKPTEPQARGY